MTQLNVYARLYPRPKGRGFTLDSRKVVNVSKKELNKLGYDNFAVWSANPSNIYIGRNMSFYVKGANASK